MAKGSAAGEVRINLAVGGNGLPQLTLPSQPTSVWAGREFRASWWSSTARADLAAATRAEVARYDAQNIKAPREMFGGR